MKPKKKKAVEVLKEGITPNSVTVAEPAPAPATVTVNPAPVHAVSYSFLAEVELSNGGRATKEYLLDVKPDSESFLSLGRAAIVHLRHHLKEGVTFDNSAVKFSVKPIM
jgi:hypothetical protein